MPSSTASTSAGTVAEPLDALRGALRRVRDGDLEVSLTVDDGGEVGDVQSGFNEMVAGLRERRAIQDLFGRHVGTEVARRALERGSGLSGDQADASAVFVDLVGSTAMAEVLPPTEVVNTLNDFFDVVDTWQDGQEKLGDGMSAVGSGAWGAAKAGYKANSAHDKALKFER